jgi:hypothetical protein
MQLLEEGLELGGAFLVLAFTARQGYFWLRI